MSRTVTAEFRHMLDVLRFDDPADTPAVYCDHYSVVTHPMFLRTGDVVCAACFESLFPTVESK